MRSFLVQYFIITKLFLYMSLLILNVLLIIYQLGTGLNCTKIKLHDVTKLHEAKFAQGHKAARGNKIARRRFCTKVSFARVTFLHECKK